MHQNTPRLIGMALTVAASSLLLSACVAPQSPPPVPGQKLTWAEQRALDRAAYQKLREDRHQDRPCRLQSCM